MLRVGWIIYYESSVHLHFISLAAKRRSMVLPGSFRGSTASGLEHLCATISPAKEARCVIAQAHSIATTRVVKAAVSCMHHQAYAMCGNVTGASNVLEKTLKLIASSN